MQHDWQANADLLMHTQLAPRIGRTNGLANYAHLISTDYVEDSNVESKLRFPIWGCCSQPKTARLAWFPLAPWAPNGCVQELQANTGILRHRAMAIKTLILARRGDWKALPGNVASRVGRCRVMKLTPTMWLQSSYTSTASVYELASRTQIPICHRDLLYISCCVFCCRLHGVKAP